MLRGVQVYIIDEDGDRVPLDLTDLKGQVVDDVEAKLDEVVDELQVINSLIPSVYDYIGLTYTGSNLTGAVFKNSAPGITHHGESRKPGANE